MKRLWWKEFRERRWWSAAWALSILASALLAGGQSFYGDPVILHSPVQMLPYAIGLLVGLGAYAGELPRAQSVFSRPIAWQKLLLAKLLYGAAICLAAAILASIVGSLIGPAAYRPLATPGHLLSGAGGVAWQYWMVYLLGLCCSTVLPGIAGSVLTFIAAVLVLMVVFIYTPLDPPGRVNQFNFSINYVAQRYGLLLGFGLGIIAAGLSLTGALLAFEREMRIKRFTIIFPVLLLAGWLAGYLLPASLTKQLCMLKYPADASINPSGTYGIFRQVWLPRAGAFDLFRQLDFSDGVENSLVNLTEGTRQQLNLPEQHTSYGEWSWADNQRAYQFDYQKRVIYVLDARTGSLRMLKTDSRPYYPRPVSPDGRILLLQQGDQRQVNEQVMMNGKPAMVTRLHWENRLTFIDLQACRQFPGRVVFQRDVVDAARNYWWQSSRIFAYRDGQQKTHYVDLRLPGNIH